MQETFIVGNTMNSVVYYYRGDDMYINKPKRKTQTSTEVKQRYKDKSYRRYQVYLRYDEDYKIIEWVDTHKDILGTTNIFRDALECYIREQDSEYF